MTGRRQVAHALVVLFAAIATYANSLGNAFALDDVEIILQNPRVHQLTDQAAIWLTPYWPSFGEHLGLYRPFAIFGYALQWSAGGGAPWVFHAVSVALHAIVSLLVFGLLRRLTSTGAALAGALLFAVHPVHTEVVANLVGQAELIAAACVVACCILWIDRAEQDNTLRYAAIVALFAIGLMAKEGAVILPGLMVALDLATGRVAPSASSITRYTGREIRPFTALIITLAAYLALRLIVLGSIGGADAAPNLPFLRQGHRFLSALRAWPEYLRLLLFPFDLSADYSPAVVLPVDAISPMVLLGAALLAVTVLLALATPWLAAAGLPAAWFFIAVFPVSNLLLPIGVLLAERILYTPSIGISIGVAFAWRHMATHAGQRRYRTATAAATAVLVVFAGRSILRNPDWKDTNAVWDALVRDHPESYRAQWVNGYRMTAVGDRELAKGYFQLAYRIWPDDAVLVNNLAGVHIELGAYEEAIPLLEHSRSLTDMVDQTEMLLSYAYLRAARYADALDATLRADRLHADRGGVMALRAQAYAGLERWDHAAGAWRYAVRQRRGKVPTFWAMLARDLARGGHDEAALAAIDTARSLVHESSPIRATIDRLADAIGRGCYAPDPSSDSSSRPAPPTCDDPLARWGVVVPPAAKEVANALQNATG